METNITVDIFGEPPDLFYFADDIFAASGQIREPQKFFPQKYLTKYFPSRKL